ncbi:MAG: PIG-L family deacetylase [Chloroflexi bacterium]|nr:PIG-L family deacetylase [Chloroflexota bacterium]
MLKFAFQNAQKGARRVLCLGAHSDDIEIGCGGALLKLLQQYDNLSIYWVVFSATPERTREARASAEAFLAGAQEKQIVIKDFRDGYFPYTGGEIKEYFEVLKESFEPDLIFTHTRNDLHQDHRVISDLTWNTFRDHLILEYEIPKYDGDLGHPNLFVQLDKATCTRKVENLIRYFGTQANKHWFTDETFLALLRLRGIESKAPDQYAEGFYCRKIIF